VRGICRSSINNRRALAAISATARRIRAKSSTDLGCVCGMAQTHCGTVRARFHIHRSLSLPATKQIVFFFLLFFFFFFAALSPLAKANPVRRPFIPSFLCARIAVAAGQIRHCGLSSLLLRMASASAVPRTRSASESQILYARVHEASSRYLRKDASDGRPSRRSSFNEYLVSRTGSLIRRDEKGTSTLSIAFGDTFR